MLRALGNMLRATLCLGVAGLIGYYNFGVNGWIGVATNAAFFALGFLLVSTWHHPEKSKSDPSLEAQSSSGTNTPVVVVEGPVRTVREVMPTTDLTAASHSSPEPSE